VRRDFSKTELRKILSANATEMDVGQLSGGVAFSSVDLVPGQVFFALKGAKVHGHQFVYDAIKKQASFIVVEDAKFLADKTIADRVLVVPDTLRALHQLTAVVRDSFKGKALGVVGSVGKTTTKDIASGIAKQFVRCCNSVKSFNTNIGIPFTICNAEIDADIWVLELGMNHPGELKELSEIVKPDALLITQIAPEHMEFFKSIEEVADAEFESLAGLAQNGQVFICSEDQHALRGLERNAKRFNNNPKVLKFGAAAISDLQFKGFSHKFGALVEGSFTLRYETRELSVLTKLIGSHNAQNFAGAVLALITLCPQINFEDLPAAIRSLEPSPMRLNQIQLSGGPLILDDTYNSSPEAVQKALDIMRELHERKLRVGIVLGDMRELGANSLQYHLDLAPFILSCHPEFMIGVGEHSVELARLVSKACQAIGVTSAAEAVSAIKPLIRTADVILMKASRGVGLDGTIKEITSSRKL
jgi:UDP-N-acetylmuramoyl-tripeptide--D-alanyl-D-alanine ligase